MGRIIPIPEPCFMDKIESVVPRLDVHFSGGHEDGFEPFDLIQPWEPDSKPFPTSQIAIKVHRVKTVFISLDDNLI